MRRCDQRSTSDKKSAYAALISNVSERYRAKDAEQFDGILRTFINETNKFENRLGKTRDEEKMLAVKKLMLDSLLNFRFRGTTLNYEELPIALENIIIDMVSRASATRQMKFDTRAPMEREIGAKDDSESSKEEGHQRIMEITKERAKAFGGPERVQAGTHRGTQAGGKVARIRVVEEKIFWHVGNCKKRGKQTEKGGAGDSRTCWTCGKAGHIAASCPKGGTKNLYPVW